MASPFTYAENHQIQGGIVADASRVNVDSVDKREWISRASNAADLPVDFSLDIQNVEKHLDPG